MVKYCSAEGCRTKARGSTRFCIKHGGGTRCIVPGCLNGGRGWTKRCVAHGGGSRCQYPGCSKGVAKAKYCTRHLGEINEEEDPLLLSKKQQKLALIQSAQQNIQNKKARTLEIQDNQTWSMNKHSTIEIVDELKEVTSPRRSKRNRQLSSKMLQLDSEEEERFVHSDRFLGHRNHLVSSFPTNIYPLSQVFSPYGAMNNISLYQPSLAYLPHIAYQNQTQGPALYNNHYQENIFSEETL